MTGFRLPDTRLPVESGSDLVGSRNLVLLILSGMESVFGEPIDPCQTPLGLAPYQQL